MITTAIDTSTDIETGARSRPGYSTYAETQWRERQLLLCSRVPRVKRVLETGGIAQKRQIQLHRRMRRYLPNFRVLRGRGKESHSGAGSRARPQRSVTGYNGGGDSNSGRDGAKCESGGSVAGHDYSIAA